LLNDSVNSLERTRKEAIAAKFKVLVWNLPARTVERISFSGYSAYRSRYEPATYRIEIGASFVHRNDASSAKLRNSRTRMKNQEE
jgi:hypothetical protein